MPHPPSESDIAIMLAVIQATNLTVSYHIVLFLVFSIQHLYCDSVSSCTSVHEFHFRLDVLHMWCVQ